MKKQIVCFYKDYGPCVRRHRWQKREFSIFVKELTEQLEVKYVGIPECDTPRHKWKPGKLEKIICKLFKDTEEDIIFWMIKHPLGEYFSLPKQLGKQIIPWELVRLGLQRMDVEDVEGLLILEYDGIPVCYTENIINRFADQINYVTAIGDKNLENVEQYLYEEFGLLMMNGKDATAFWPTKNVKWLVVDEGSTLKKWMRRLPENCIYYDLQSDIRKKMKLFTRRKDICYIAVLDTIYKNRYNT